MISPEEVREKAKKWWNTQTFLQAWLRSEDFFEDRREITHIGLVKSNEVLGKFTQILDEQEQLKANSKKVKGFGYQLEWEKVNHQKLGENEFITKIYFDTATDFLAFIRKEADFEQFIINRQLIISTIPNLETWILDNPLKVIEYSLQWDKLLKVCRYFIENPVPNLYIRQLPIDVHTKFIEQNEGILKKLLDHLLPAEGINQQETKFEKRYGLRYKEEQVRFRILDKKLFLAGLSEVSLPISQFIQLPIIPEIKIVFIAENDMNILTFPSVKNAIIIFGKGKNITHLKPVEWLTTKQIFYWGDLDVEGFEILSSLRNFCPNVVSFLMDTETLKSYQDFMGQGANSVRCLPPNLTHNEQKAFKQLKDSGKRLEQEKIGQKQGEITQLYVEDYLKQMIANFL